MSLNIVYIDIEGVLIPTPLVYTSTLRDYLLLAKDLEKYLKVYIYNYEGEGGFLKDILFLIKEIYKVLGSLFIRQFINLSKPYLII